MPKFAQRRYPVVALLAAACWILCTPVSALYEEDAGVLDFLIATSGHGVEGNVVTSTQKAVITAGACQMASRSIVDGSLLWRRNVCSTPASQSAAAAAASSSDVLVTNDAEGSVRMWTVEDGALLWDTPSHSSPSSSEPRVWTASTKTHSLVAATSSSVDGGDDVLTVYDAPSGRSYGSLKASGVVGGKGAHWLLVQSSTKETRIQALLTSVSKPKGGKEQVCSKFTLVELAVEENNVLKVESSIKFSADSPLLVSSLQFQTLENDNVHVFGLDVKGQNMIHVCLTSGVSHTVNVSHLHPLWTSLEAILVPTSPQQPNMIRILGHDNRYSPPRYAMALFRYDASTSTWDQWYAMEDETHETSFRGIAYCPESNLVVAVERNDKVIAFQVKPSTEAKTDTARLTGNERHRQNSPLIPLHVTGDTIMLDLSEGDPVTDMQVLVCKQDSTTALLTTARGTVVELTVSKTDNGVSSKVEWTTEEGLGQVSDALLLDASHSVAVLEAVSAEEEAAALKRLSFSSRLQSQVNDLVSFVTQRDTASSRDLDFGFVKVAMLLSQSAHRVWGMPTFGSSKGKIQWTVDLPRTAEWHALIHGTTSSKSIVHGIGSGTHSPEVLVLSSMPDSTTKEWTCLDGITGKAHSSGSSEAASPVVQVLPLFGGFGMCRQLAVLVHKDNTISVLPNDDNGKETLREHIHSNKNGLYTHTVDRVRNLLQAYQVQEESSSFVMTLVGHTAFAGERIVEVAYPQRDEVVQAPYNILGDDSLLLKYLNPHLAVILTVSDDSSDPDELSLALSSSKGGTGKKRKPMGVTPPGDSIGGGDASKSPEDTPNLFVNLVDTVSGRVLYRISHSNASPEQHIPILISENWIIYAFFNEKIRRTEVGVLTMYEGMIDKTGLTAFSSPEQSLSFSSFEARDAKPVVLAKTYVVPKLVTALGMTATRDGISSRHVLLACGDDRIMSIPRQMLEPRRPTGDVKVTEKQEGLFQYSALIPLVPLWSPSYNQTVDAAKSMVSTFAGLESQSLVLAYGGADIFFTRMSPSKGFDLLPENFNRILLTVVLIGLLVAVGVVRDMGKKKMVKMAWS